ncbi:MAG: aminodeoxychorismate lyase, partial [Bifidobacterium crudilactis]|nr:aminodeoxychorismate lyase [Bifidobacterium crudilactis]
MANIVLGKGNASALFSAKAPSAGRSGKLLEFVEPEALIVSPFDLAVTRGDGIFEATTVWKGYPVSLENHLLRLAYSARLMDMPE